MNEARKAELMAHYMPQVAAVCDQTHKMASDLAGTAEGDQSVMPGLVAGFLTHDGKQSFAVYGIALPFNSDDEKLAAAIYLGRSLSQASQNGEVCVAISLISEAWTAIVKPGEQYVRPADHPDRQEVLIVQSLALGSNLGRMSSREISRDAAGAIHCNGEWQHADGCEMYLLQKVFSAFAAFRMGQIENLPEVKLDGIREHKLAGDGEGV